MVRTLRCLAVIVITSLSLFGQTSEKPPAFEVADVHATPPSVLNPPMAGGVPRDGRYELRNATMLDLIRTAYEVSDAKVVGGPSWLTTDRCNVIAKVPQSVTTETARLMLRTLLADRFGLKVHEDSKPVPAFVLSAGRGAHKMKASEGAQSGCQGQQQQP